VANAEDGAEEVRWREIELLTFHPPTRGSARLDPIERQGGQAPTRRPEGRRAHFCKLSEFACGLPGAALRLPSPTASPSAAARRIGRSVPPSLTLPGHPRGWIAPRAQLGRTPAGGAPGSAAKEERSPLGSPLPWGMGAKHTHAICVAFGNALCSAAYGRLVDRSAAERRADRGLCEGEKDARR
jgi:hypothetical protein